MSDVSRRHHRVVRVTHWVNVVALTIMVGSGLRIFNAYPAFARKGETFCCYPFEGTPIPAWLTFGGWLAGARNWHFAMMWVLVVERARLSRLHLSARRVARPRSAPRRSSATPGEMVKFYLALRQDHPRQGKHNALQRLAYFAMPVVGDRLGADRARDLEAGAARRRSRRCSAATCGRATGTSWRWCSLVVARRRPRVHGVRRRSVFAALDRSRAGTTRRGRPKRATRGRSSICCRSATHAPTAGGDSEPIWLPAPRIAERIGVDRRAFLAAG